MVRVSQPVLSMLPSGARAIGPSAGLLEGPDGGVVFVFGLATFSYAAGDEVGRRLTAVQLVAMRISSAREVAGAFGVSTVPRVAERTAARFGELAEAPVVFTEVAHLRRVDAGFNLLTYYKGTWTRSEPTAFATVDFTTPDGTTATYELAERLIDLAVPARPATPAQAGRPASTLTLRLIVRRSPSGHQTPILTNRTDLSAPLVAYRMATRWRQENYFKYAREHFALDALDSYADQPDDLDRMVPNPAKAHAHDQVSAARTQVGAAHADIAAAFDTASIAARRPGSGGTATVEAAPGRALTAGCGLDGG